MQRAVLDTYLSGLDIRLSAVPFVSLAGSAASIGASLASFHSPIALQRSQFPSTYDG